MALLYSRGVSVKPHIIVKRRAHHPAPNQPYRQTILSTKVGRTCTLLEHNRTRVLIDCGIEQGADETPPGQRTGSNTLPFDASTIDAVVLTHGHLD
ncbi:MAG: MBL fold metallo-hydrolase, partial [Chitinispirillaceae bacterium]